MPVAFALHTTTAELHLAVADLDGDNLRQHAQGSWFLGRELSSQLHLCAADIMAGRQWRDLAFIAVASGVGSYTGTRVGVVFARTLGEQLRIPVYAIACPQIEAAFEAMPPAERTLASALLSIAWQRWQAGERPPWYAAIPLYDGAPVGETVIRPPAPSAP